MPRKRIILLLDFGSQYTNLIKTQLFKLGVNAVIVPGDITFNEYKAEHSPESLAGIILSGGAQSVYDNHIEFDDMWLKLDIPVLGICYGHQLLASCLGGKVIKGKQEYGNEKLILKEQSLLFEGLTKESIVWMSHSDTVVRLPKGFVRTASTNHSDNAAIANETLSFYGIQFHPEVSHTEQGLILLENFVCKICKITPSAPWSAEKFVKDTIISCQKRVKDEGILIGLSGGVDSMTLAALLRRAVPKNQLTAVYMDTGLMPDETKDEVVDFCQQQDIHLIVHSAQSVFFYKLKGISDPTEKGMVIGKTFISEFYDISKDIHATYFAQGTIWSDVVESGITKFSSRIKPHHNVGGLPPSLPFTLLEPLRELFKDQVRQVASYLELPSNVVNKKVFPGPGFAIRVDGEVTKEKVELVKKSTKIIEEVIAESEIKNKLWMAFAILINVKSLGVKGDKRIENKHAIVIRVVESRNSMTVNFSEAIYPYLATISRRIVKETDMGRVVYDITDKPPATIEWQ